MDPTHEFVVYRPPGTPKPKFSQAMMPIPFLRLTQVEVVPPPAITTATVIPSSVATPFVDNDLFSQLSTIKSQFNRIEPSEFRRLRGEMNPYENLKTGPFINRAALKMANIDALYRLTGHFNGLLVQQIYNENWRFASIAEGPGGFVQYLQYRSTGAHGHGITLQSEVDYLNWDVEKLDMARFDIDYFERTTGNIVTEWDGFCRYVLSRSGPLNLVTADGGIEIEDDFERQEYLNSKLIFTEVLMALVLVAGTVDEGPADGGLKRGGDFVLKVFDTVSKISADTIYILTRCFGKVSILKPVTSRPANSERYIVCQTKHPDTVTAPWLNLMKEVKATYDEGVDVGGFIETLDQEFIDWLVLHNNISMRSQIEAGQMIIDVSQGKSVTVPRVDLMECLTVWNLSSPKDEKVCNISFQTKEPNLVPRTSRLDRTWRGRGRGRR